ncbi:MAG: dynamin family protein [Caulobacteraceae bacterium]
MTGAPGNDPRGSSPLEDAPPAMVALLDRALVLATDDLQADALVVAQLRGLRDRLIGERLQLAVVGQFKRGKSSLLNALLGQDILPTGVLPLTAIPTFLEQGARPELRVDYKDGRCERETAADSPALKSRLAGLVTEEGNPGNARGLSRVTVCLPAAFFDGGVALIDTPGVGSTLRHNTDAAEAILPACDAALFVLSPDPPITEIEIGYLARVRLTAPRVIVVLNKADIVNESELAAIENFLREALAKTTGESSLPIFRVSARSAPRARLAGDALTIAASGLSALEAHLRDLMVREKQVVLGAAIAGKARSILTDLRLRNELALGALRMPLTDLARRRVLFDEAIGGFESDRQAVRDLLAGEEKRTLEWLDEEATRLRKTVSGDLARRVDYGGVNPDVAWRAMQQELPTLFEVELSKTIATLRRRIDASMNAHREKIERLVGHVKRAAAELMDVRFDPESLADVVEMRQPPYWVVKPAEALNPIPPGAFEKLMPAKLRGRLALRRVGQEIEATTVRNVENLRWSMRQSAVEAFRRFAARLDERFAASLATTRDVMDDVLRRRAAYVMEVEAEVEQRLAASTALQEIERDLLSMAAA